MNKIVSNQLKKIIISVIIILVLTAFLFVLTSCKRNIQQDAAGGNVAVADAPAAETTIDAGTGTTNQASTSGNETIAETTGTDTETTLSSETTSQTTKPQTQQVIEVSAKTGGYSPGKVEAKAGIQTILIMKSEGAYGCERAFNILDRATKKILFSEILPDNGQTEFDLGIQAKGTELIGICSMGMYYFQILFN